MPSDDEEKENPCANFPKGLKFGEWSIVNKLDEGGFGQVYKVQNIKQPTLFAALKAEPNDVEGGSAIKLEMSVLKQMSADGPKIHVPVVYHAAKHKKFCYMVMMLLGENLKHLKNRCPGERMTPGTWARLAIQCVYGIKLVHDYGYVHRDIKPNNFVMGHPSDAERARIVHILDFGLTRPYASKTRSGQWVARRARGSAEFRGTLRYCSPNVHEKQEQGRRDDLWGLLYVLIEFHCGLPWQKIQDKHKVEKMKIHYDDKTLMSHMPPECADLPKSLRNINCYQRPDYLLWVNAFNALLKRLDVKFWDPYDWESKTELDAQKEKTKGAMPLWMTAAEAFFSSDPVRINGPPPKKRAGDITTAKLESYEVDSKQQTKS